MGTQSLFVFIRRRAALLALAGVLAAAPLVLAQGPAVDDAALTALSAYAERDYARALDLYRALSEAHPQDGTYPFMMAKCHNRLGQPKEALAAIDQATANGATFNAIEYERGRALFLLGDDARAVAAYEAFHQKSPCDAISNQFFAEALEAVGRHQEALDRLQKVRPPKELQLRQEVLLAVAEAGVNRPKDALARIDKLSSQPVDLETRKFLFSLRAQVENKAFGVEREAEAVAEAPKKERRPWNLALSLGAEYDTNIPAHGEEPKIRRRGLEELDGWRGYAAMDASYRYEFTDRFAVTGFLEGYGNRNGNHLSEFDVHYIKTGLNPEYRLWESNIFGGLEGWYAHTWLNSEGFVNEIGMQPYLSLIYSQYAATKISVSWRWQEFDDKPEFNFREDQDGRELRFEIAQEWRVKNTDLVLRGGYYQEHESREGADLDANRKGVFFGFRYKLPFEVFVSGRIDYSRQHFRNQNSRLQFRNILDDLVTPESPGERNDTDLIFSVQLSRQIVDGLDLTIYHTTYDEESNVNEYDYDRSIWGSALTYRF